MRERIAGRNVVTNKLSVHGVGRVECVALKNLVGAIKVMNVMARLAV